MTLRVLTWHVHGSYLAALGLGAAHGDYQLLVPSKPGRPEGYGGRAGRDDWPASIVEVPAEAVRDLDVDVVLTQSTRGWEVDRHEVCSAAQLAGPRVHLEHDPPRASPFEQRHPVDDPGALLVHVTAFNDLVWDSGATPTAVVEHGADVGDARWTGELARGLVIANGLATRGRRMGADLVERVRREIALDVVGMGSEAVGGLGEVPSADLPALIGRYRFVFHPARWTSLGLAVCEAMCVGAPVVGVAATELPAVIADGVTGYVASSPDVLVARMRALLDDPALAARIGAAGRAAGRARFGIERFGRDWGRVLADAAARG